MPTEKKRFRDVFLEDREFVYILELVPELGRAQSLRQYLAVNRSHI
jgi:hypothetical protein